MKWPGSFINKIICGDCLEVMKEMPDECVDLIVTSPPYGNLRDYSGDDFNFKEIANQLFRICKDGSVLVWVVGDVTINGNESGTSFKQALYFKEIGFNLHDTMIYGKIGFRYPATNRYNAQFEYMFILSRNNPKTFNPLKYKHKMWYATSKLITERQKDGTLKQKRYSSSDWDIMLGNIWFYDIGYMKSTKDKVAYEHPAIFPDRLAQDHIISWSNKEDVVLDPFIGSGTTARAAKDLKRRYIGIDISPKYYKIAEERLAQGVL